MFSILIPVYNFDITDLVKELHRQAKQEDIEFEILCVDDCSSITFSNHKLSKLAEVKYEVLTQNLGRAKIRNRLANQAKYDHLLFLDCDSKIINPSFLQTYLGYVSGGKITIGGRVYNDKAPTQLGFVLHWKYGLAKESRTLMERRQYPIRYFHSNNFLISKQDFLSVGFDENIKGYGYEDLVFAEVAFRKGLELIHIENYVEHLGLELNKDFIDKTERAISNLIELRKQGVLIETNLTQLATRIEKFKLTKFFTFLHGKLGKKYKANLLSNKPSLRQLDLYKLGWYLKNYRA